MIDGDTIVDGSAGPKSGGLTSDSSTVLVNDPLMSVFEHHLFLTSHYCDTVLSFRPFTVLVLRITIDSTSEDCAVHYFSLHQISELRPSPRGWPGDRRVGHPSWRCPPPQASPP